MSMKVHFIKSKIILQESKSVKDKGCLIPLQVKQVGR